MARLTDFSAPEQKHHLEKIRDLPDFGATPFVPGPPLDERRVAIVTTSGLHARGDRPFDIGAADYRVIPGDTPAADLVMSHVSVNFDRSGFQEDINVVFPHRPAARVEGRRRHRVGGGFPLLVHGRRADPRARAQGARAGRAAEEGSRRRGAADACLTELHVRRGRTGPLPRARGRPDRADQPDPGADRGDQAAARAVGAVHARAAVRRAERAGFPAPGAARTLLSLFERPAGPVLEDFPEDAPARRRGGLRSRAR